MSKPRKLPKGSEKTIVFNFFNFLNFLELSTCETLTFAGDYRYCSKFKILKSVV